MRQGHDIHPRGEDRVLSTRKHCIVFASIVIQTICVLGFIGYFRTIPAAHVPVLAQIDLMTLFQWLFISWIILMWGLTGIDFYLHKIHISNVRLWVFQGWLIRRSTEMMLARIECVELRQSLFGRMFGYGSLVISGVSGQALILKTIPKPRRFKNHLQRTLLALNQSGNIQ